MAQPQRPIPPYAAVMYDFCDVLYEIAQQNSVGPGWAKVLASAAVTSAAAYYPKAAKSVLGDQMVATYKNTAEKLPVRFKVAPVGDEFDQLGQQIADAARQMAMQAGGDRKTIIDQLRSYAMQLATPQKTTKAAKVDPLIAAIQSGGNWDGR